MTYLGIAVFGVIAALVIGKGVLNRWDANEAAKIDDISKTNYVKAEQQASAAETAVNAASEAVKHETQVDARDW